MDQRLVGEYVELLHVLALHVDLTGDAERTGQAGLIDAAADDLARQRQLLEQPGKFAGRVRVQALLFEDVTLERPAVHVRRVGIDHGLAPVTLENIPLS